MIKNLAIVLPVLAIGALSSVALYFYVSAPFTMRIEASWDQLVRTNGSWHCHIVGLDPTSDEKPRDLVREGDAFIADGEVRADFIVATSKSKFVGNTSFLYRDGKTHVWMDDYNKILIRDWELHPDHGVVGIDVWHDATYTWDCEEAVHSPFRFKLPGSFPLETSTL